MKDYDCLDIEFPTVDFNPYHIKCDSVSKIHHAHLYADSNDEIVLRIFYEDKTYFGEKLSTWAGTIDWKKFGSFIQVKNVSNNDRLRKIDLSEAELRGIQSSSSNYEGGKRYVVVKIDTAKFYWSPVPEKINTAEFYLNDAGFRVVKPFYSILFGFDGKFNISRMDGMDNFFTLGKSEFRPEFDTYSNDSKNNKVATIVKEPKIEFKYKEPVTEGEAIFYGEVVLTLASFFHHIKIDYTLRRIHLPEHTITIKKIERKNYLETGGGLWGFGIIGELNKFLQTNWQQGLMTNFSTISKAVTLFNQALLVDSTSSFLIRYNIIEICDKIRPEKVKFNFATNEEERKKKFEESLNILLQTINTDEKEQFKVRWNNVQELLQNKPMVNQLVTFLKSQNLNPDEFPIKVKELKELRDQITHGSVSNIDIELLRKANILLYRISGILILNLMGIKDWKLTKEII
jgi:hypothetical protein